MVVSLVEDEPTVLSLLAELLRVHGHDARPILIEHADTLPDTLDRLAAENAPVVIMDLGMPVSGHDLLDAAHADPRFQSVRFIVATASFEGARNLPKSSRIMSIAKPYDLKELLPAILGVPR